MAFYLCGFHLSPDDGWVPNGWEDFPRHPEGWIDAGFVDLRTNPDPAVGYALVFCPTPLSGAGILPLEEHLDSPISGSVRQQIAAEIGVNMPPSSTVRDAIREILTRTADGWEPVAADPDGKLRVHMGRRWDI